jgi:hypothetical protein
MSAFHLSILSEVWLLNFLRSWDKPRHFVPPSGHTEGRQRHQEAGAEKHLEGKHFFTSRRPVAVAMWDSQRPQGAIKILFEFIWGWFIIIVYTTDNTIGHIRDELLLVSQHESRDSIPFLWVGRIDAPIFCKNQDNLSFDDTLPVGQPTYTGLDIPYTKTHTWNAWWTIR